MISLNSGSESPIFIDLFCGAGGLSLGFEKAGFQIGCAVDSHPDPLKTYKKNRSGLLKNSQVITGDIHLLRGNQIIKQVPKGLKDIDVIIGGPPCQGFSIRGKRKKNDPRNVLVHDFFRIIKEVQPKIFVFENVSGLLTKINREILKEIIEKIRKLNYNFSLDLLNSSDYGVPQNRKRLFIIGNKNSDNIAFPKKTENGIKKKILEELDVKPPNYNVIPIVQENKKIKVIEALDDISYNSVTENPTEYLKEQQGPYQTTMKGDYSKLHNHITTKHKPSTIEIFKKFKEGQNMKDIPKQYQNKRSTVYRMNSIKPARTITSCNEDFIHYSLNRIITIREMARLQSYPDYYKFEGVPTTGGNRRRLSCCQVQQIGNSVTPLLAQAIAEAVLKMLGCKSNKSLATFIKNLNKRPKYEKG